MPTLRPATLADVEAIRALTDAAFEPYVPRMGVRPAPMDADHAASVREGHVWVAELDGAIAGFVVLQPQPGHLYLDILAVAPAAQGRGVGAALLELAETQARERGLAEVRLCTNEAMTENLAYYPRRGYAETHRSEQHGFRRVFFRKTVTPGDARR